jgi:hypothetical protein
MEAVVDRTVVGGLWGRRERVQKSRAKKSPRSKFQFFVVGTTHRYIKVESNSSLTNER